MTTIPWRRRLLKRRSPSLKDYTYASLSRPPANTSSSDDQRTAHPHCSVDRHNPYPGRRLRSATRTFSLLLIAAIISCAVLPANTATSIHRKDAEDHQLSEAQVMQLEDETRHHQLSSLNLPVSNRKLILNKYAPLVFLHPRDRWRPADPAYVFSKSKLDEYNRTVLIPEELWHGNEVAESATVQANIVGQVVQMGPHGKTYLQYWFFYPVNGCQGFRISLWSGLRSFVKERAENFEWCKMAYHNGDWEHITVQLNDTWDGNSEQSIPPIRAVAFSQHAGSEWVYLPDLAFTGTHPHVYSALNSHANYPTEGTHKNRDDTFGFVSRISPLLTLGAVQWIQIADVADLSSDLFLFEEPIGKRFQRFISWMTWTGEVYDWTDKSDWSEWARYSGFWGAEVDQTTILQPPPGVTAARQLHWSTTIAQKLGILNKFVRKHERGPKGPRQHRTWYTLDQPPRNID